MPSTAKISTMGFERIRRTPSKTYDTNEPLTEISALDLCLDASENPSKEYEDFMRTLYTGVDERLREKGLF